MVMVLKFCKLGDALQVYWVRGSPMKEMMVMVSVVMMEVTLISVGVGRLAFAVTGYDCQVLPSPPY